VSANKPGADPNPATPKLSGNALTASPALQSATSQRRSADDGRDDAPDGRVRMVRAATAMAVLLADGRRASVEYWPGRGAPLVLLHGLLDCAAGWKHLAQATHRPCYAVDLAGFGDSDCPTRNRISAYAEDVQGALATLDVHDFTLVGHSLGGAVATALAERLRDDVTALVLMAPAGFGRIRLAEAIGLPVVRSVVRHGLPLALVNPVTALGVYMAVIGNGHLPDPELVARLRKNAYRWAPGAQCANEAITASGLSPRAFYRRQIDYQGPVLALWGDRDRLVPIAHRDGVMTAFPQARVSVWKKMGHHAQRERPSQLARFIEGACARARRERARRRTGLQRAEDAVESQPRRGRVPAPALTPQSPTTTGPGEAEAVA
jgi:pimeloyl-ACP methyl ester carboxylesterase